MLDDAMEMKHVHGRYLKHELRTCLNQILGFCDLLLESSMDQGDVILADHVKAIHKTAEEMRTVIGAMTGEVGTGKEHLPIETQSTQLRTLAGDVRGRLETAAQDANDADASDLKHVDEACARMLALLDPA